MRKLKYLVLGLAFSACMVSLTGCGSDDDNNGSNQPGTSRETTTNRETSTNRETESNGNNNSATTGKLDEIGMRWSILSGDVPEMYIFSRNKGAFFYRKV